MTVMQLRHAWKDSRTESARTARRRVSLLVLIVAWIGRTLPPFATMRASVLRLGGLALLDWSAYLLHPVAGYASAGLSLLLLEWFTDRNKRR